MRNPYTRIEPYLALPVAAAAVLVLPAGGVLPLASVFLYAGILMLLQSLIRDVYLLASRRAGAGAETARRGWFLCVESAVGLGLVLQGLLLGALDTRAAITLPGVAWFAAVLVWWWIGFAVREVVFEVRRDPDHLNLLVGPRR